MVTSSSAGSSDFAGPNMSVLTGSALGVFHADGKELTIDHTAGS